MNKILVIHPEDPTTDFLKEIYRDKPCDIITNWDRMSYSSRLGRNKNISQLNKIISKYNRVLMLGHGHSYGMFIIPVCHLMVPVFKNQPNNVYIWCNADQFVNRHNLKGFYTGMMISEVGEATMFNIKTNQKEIDLTNELFSTAVRKAIWKDDTNLILETAKREFDFTTSSPIIEFNHERLYYNKDEADTNEEQVWGHNMDQPETNILYI